MKKYLITLLFMVIGCEVRLHAMIGNYETIQDNIRTRRSLIKIFIPHTRSIFDIGGIPEREMQKMRDTTDRIVQEEQKRREEQSKQVMQRLLQEIQLAEQQWRLQEQQQRQVRQERQLIMLERRAAEQAIKHQKKIYNNNHCAQTRSKQYNARVNQPRSNRYAAKNNR